MTGRHWYHKQWLKLVESDYFHTTNNQSRMRLSLDVCCPWACVTLSHKWSGVGAQETNEGHASCGRSLKECNPCDNRFQFSIAFEKHTSPQCTPCTAATSSTFQGLVTFLQNCAQFIKISWWLEMAVENTVGHSSGGRSRVCLLLHTCGPHVRVRSEKLSIVKVTLHWTHGEWRSVAIILQRSSSMYEEGTLHTN